MIYLASPYSSPDPLIVRTRFLLAEQVTAILMSQGHYVYSPIVHCHEIAVKYAIPTDFAYWSGYNIDMIRRCDALYILTISGWEESKGVTGELAFAQSAGLEIAYVDEEGQVRWQK